MIEISFFSPLSTWSDACNMAEVIVDVNAGRALLAPRKRIVRDYFRIRH
jgi:hypothetical protein